MRPAARVASLLGLSEGQVYTVTTSLAVALVLLGIGLPSLRSVAPQLPAASAASSPLELPGSPAVAEVIRAEDPPPAPVLDDGSAFAAPTLDTSTPPSPQPPPSRPGPGPSSDEPSPSSDPAPVPTPAPSAPLEIALGRYATASGPLLLAGGPGEHLPVALRLGTPDKQSYLRLQGTATTLRLDLSVEPGHQLGEPLEVRACRITAADWEIEDGSSLDEAPEVDLDECALGVAGADGWTFELAAVDTANGVALVPSGPPTGSFQVTFAGEEP